MSAHFPKPWSVEDFLAWERQQLERYEFVAGVIRMMTGSTLDHNTIVGNIFAALRAALAETPCRVFMENAKVVTDTASAYPDVVVTCSPVNGRDDIVPQPVVLLEVLSRSTADYDRGSKWQAYQGIPSLRHYVLISQDQVRVEIYSRQQGAWSYAAITDAKTHIPLPIPMQGALRIDLDTVFADTSLRDAKS